MSASPEPVTRKLFYRLCSVSARRRHPWRRRGSPAIIGQVPAHDGGHQWAKVAAYTTQLGVYLQFAMQVPPHAGYGQDRQVDVGERVW